MDRKLAAILAADVVGYSALMEQDEQGKFLGGCVVAADGFSGTWNLRPKRLVRKPRRFRMPCIESPHALWMCSHNRPCLSSLSVNQIT
jgi:hypothetical protein